MRQKKRIPALMALSVLHLAFAAMTRFSPSPASSSSSPPATSQPVQQFGGRGGYSQTSADMAPTPTLPPELQTHICGSYVVTPANAISIVFSQYGITTDFLSDAYKTTATPTLCF